MNNNTIDLILQKYNGMLSSEGKSAFIAHALKNERTSNVDYARDAILYFEKRGQFSAAAGIQARFKLNSLNECEEARNNVPMMNYAELLQAGIDKRKAYSDLAAHCKNVMRVAEVHGCFDVAAEAADKIYDHENAGMYDELHEFIAFGVNYRA